MPISYFFGAITDFFTKMGKHGNHKIIYIILHDIISW